MEISIKSAIIRVRKKERGRFRRRILSFICRFIRNLSYMHLKYLPSGDVSFNLVDHRIDAAGVLKASKEIYYHKYKVVR